MKFCENNDSSLGNIVLRKAHSENIKPVVKTGCSLFVVAENTKEKSRQCFMEF
jgi:hypothetical protein